MKKILLIIFLLISYIGFSQKKTIYIKTKDNRYFTAHNYVTHKQFLRLKIKDSAPVDLPYYLIEEIKKVYTKEKDQEFNATYHFVPFSKRYGAIMKLEVKGKCNLYSNTEMAFGGGTGLGFFALRQGETIATQLCDHNFVTLINFKFKASKYFNDCTALVKKIKSKKFKRKQVIKAVEFYNTNCN